MNYAVGVIAFVVVGLLFAAWVVDNSGCASVQAGLLGFGRIHWVLAGCFW